MEMLESECFRGENAILKTFSALRWTNDVLRSFLSTASIVPEDYCYRGKGVTHLFGILKHCLIYREKVHRSSSAKIIAVHHYH
jgi:hypothetical protein